MKRALPLAAAVVAAFAGMVSAGGAEEKDPAREAAAVMSPARMIEIVRRLDPEAQEQANTVRFKIAERAMILIYDEKSERMRIMSPISPESALDPSGLLRLMQANFDSALDARYAVAQSLVWALFVHPLVGLSDEEFISGIGQTANLAHSFGTTYSSSGMVFGGGDSGGLLEQELNEALKEKGTPI